MHFPRQVLKFAAANFILQDGIACLNHITTIYSAFAGVSDADLILGHVFSVFFEPYALQLVLLTLPGLHITPQTYSQVLGRLFGSISAVLWVPFCQRFGTHFSYFVSMSIGVVACLVILFPMSPPLFWFVN
jgi:hypothetical protein